MPKSSDRQIYVWLQLASETVHIGTLWMHPYRQTQASFAYTDAWLNHSAQFALQPALPLLQGQTHSLAGKATFGAIGDSAPDSWGRRLMHRAEQRRAKARGEMPRKLTEADYLLGVNDEARQGALRFSEADDRVFLSPSNDHNIPPLVKLGEILGATERYLADDETYDDLKLLMQPGTSLGGARPKASVWDKDRRLAIAKFHKPDDGYNVVVWEAVALALAGEAGLEVSESRIEKIAKLENKPVLIVRRFDRSKTGGRIPFLSAMAMVDAEDHDDDHSYSDIARVIIQHSSRANADLAEMWRRIIFNVLICNRDDHLRNHAFLYEFHKGWRLSPLYDVNPSLEVRKPRMLESESLASALAIAGEFRLTQPQAKDIAAEVARVIAKNWRRLAHRHGLSAQAIDDMAGAFVHDDATQAMK